MRIVLSLLMFFALAPAALAQEQATEEKPKATVAEPIAPYDDQLLRLSEVLGSIHYLRALCGANEGNQWRDAMGELIATEEPGPNRRARLVSSFNRGYRAFSTTYTSCTPAALLAVDRYMKEGVSLTSQITGRYGR
ncbi:MAG: TIGR02301 family protein [Pseudomonadota bacterium]